MGSHVIVNPQRGWFEEMRTLGYASVAANYAAIGAETTHPTRILIINNLTDKHVKISFDGTTDHITIPAGGNFVLDTVSNGISLPGHATFYVKRYSALEAPTSGDIIVSVGYLDHD
jgi:hypothetical protein